MDLCARHSTVDGVSRASHGLVSGEIPEQKMEAFVKVARRAALAIEMRGATPPSNSAPTRGEKRGIGKDSEAPSRSIKGKLAKDRSA